MGSSSESRVFQALELSAWTSVISLERSPSGPTESVSDDLGQQLKHSPIALSNKSWQLDSVIMRLNLFFLCYSVQMHLTWCFLSFFNVKIHADNSIAWNTRDSDEEPIDLPNGSYSESYPIGSGIHFGASLPKPKKNDKQAALNDIVHRLATDIIDIKWLMQHKPWKLDLNAIRTRFERDSNAIRTRFERDSNAIRIFLQFLCDKNGKILHHFTDFSLLWTMQLILFFVRYFYTWKSSGNRMWRKNRRPSAQLLLRSSLPRQFWPGAGIPSYPGKKNFIFFKIPQNFFFNHIFFFMMLKNVR